MAIDPKAPLCPTDSSPLEYKDASWHCPACANDFRLQGLCNTCGQELEKLTACGATNWFCNHCKELKSKSVVEYRLLPAG